MSADLARKWAELESQRRALEGEAKSIKERQAEIEANVLEWFAEQGVEHIAISDLGTIFTRNKFKHWPKSGAEQEAKLSALRAAGFGDLIAEGYSWSSLNARLSETVRNGEELPSELEEMFMWRDEPVLTLRAQ